MVGMVPRRYRAASSFVVCSLIPMSTGCATIEMQHVNTTERVIKTDRKAEQDDDATATVATSDDGTPIVTVRRGCKVWATDRVEVTDHTEAKNKSATTDWAFGISGAALIGLGGWGVADAGKTYPNDTTSRTYNPVGPDGERSAGYVTIGVGLVLLGVGVVDAVRANGTSQSVKVEARRRPDPVDTCKGKAAAGVVVEVRFDKGATKGTTARLGVTDASGQVVVDFADVNPPAETCGLEKHPFGEKATIVVANADAGTIVLGSAYDAWIARRKANEAVLWKDASAALPECAKGGDCTAVRRFAGSHPCYELTKEREAKLASALDENAWVRSGSVACNSSPSVTACDGVSAYLSAFPSGRHSADGERLVSAWQKRRRDIFQKLDTWMRGAVTTTWSQQLVTKRTCYNRVDVEVPCDSAAAFKKDESELLVSKVLVRNGSSVPVACGLGAGNLFRSTSDAATVPAGATHTFTAVDVGFGAFATIYGGGGKTIACAMEASSMNKHVPGSAPALDISSGNVVFAISTGDKLTVYGFVSKDERIFLWNGREVVELKKS